MPTYLPIGRNQEVAVADGATLRKDELEDLGLLADEIQACTKILTHPGVLGLVIDGVNVRITFGVDTRKARP